MKTLVIVILDGFADWEASLLAPALRYFTDYSILYASQPIKTRKYRSELYAQNLI
ncbi:hypothetical protein [uncultured Campylobacter sp.]|uniref:hypothetical protein n=1 Tax=uncultured Campylobacter sp. TaxID=218934 RepID=UPI0026241014|nr:hypothetical protein [uncultured Campylobacter sp.]